LVENIEENIEQPIEPCSICGENSCICPVAPSHYVTFDDDGNVFGFYNDALNSDIPKYAIPITSEHWQEYAADSHLYRLDEDGETIRLKTADELAAEQAELPPLLKSPEQLRIEALEAQSAALMMDLAAKDIQTAQQNTIIADLMLSVAQLQLGGAK